jgi:cytidine deaminase
MPFSFVRNQQPTGFEIEILQAALEGSGLGIEFKPMRSLGPGAGRAVQRGGAYRPGHHAFGPARQALIYPDTPTVELGIKFFVNRASLIRNVEQLRGQTVATRRGSVTQACSRSSAG